MKHDQIPVQTELDVRPVAKGFAIAFALSIPFWAALIAMVLA